MITSGKIGEEDNGNVEISEKDNENAEMKCKDKKECKYEGRRNVNMREEM